MRQADLIAGTFFCVLLCILWLMFDVHDLTMRVEALEQSQSIEAE